MRKPAQTEDKVALIVFIGMIALGLFLYFISPARGEELTVDQLKIQVLEERIQRITTEIEVLRYQYQQKNQELAEAKKQLKDLKTTPQTEEKENSDGNVTQP